VTPAQVDGLTETFEKIIKDQGGSVAKTESWGLRSLAYRIKKNRKGYYVLFNIDAPPAAIQEMERQMQLNEDVIRFLTTRVEELEEGPSAFLKAKERGDDRDRGYRGGRDRDRDRDRDSHPRKDEPKKSQDQDTKKADKPADEAPKETAPEPETKEPETKKAKTKKPETKEAETAKDAEVTGDAKKDAKKEGDDK
jgi:small subunit ribosomal protein S6